MSEQLLAVFDSNKTKGKPTFVAFITGGFPTQKDTVPLLLALQEGGADVIELGIPYSDPIADGPTIQEASTVALLGGTTPSICLQFVKEARKAGLTVPVVFMGYYNPIYKYGEKKMVQDAKDAGVNGFILVDLPPEESKDFYNSCVENKIAYIPLIAPNTTDERLDFVNSIANSFVYCVSVLGVTGERKELPKELPEFIRRVKKRVKAPIAIGFGISTRETFFKVSKLGEGVVVGSHLIRTISRAPQDSKAPTLRDTCKELNTPEPGESYTEESHETGSLQGANGEGVERLPSSFGQFGGKYAPEILMGALDELELAYVKLKNDPEFHKELRSFYSYVGRPTPLYLATRLSQENGGAKIWLKREDLAHTGAHKINNAIGQALIAKRLGKHRIIAETGAGQHGVATATICAKLGLECIVYMGAEDVQRQSLNVFRMKCMGATVIPVHSGSKTLKDAINEAMRDWVTNIRTTHYLIGSAIGPHPFPTIVRDLQSVIGKEARSQFLEINGKLPDVVTACVGGGSNSIGMFHPFIEDKEVKLVGVEAAGEGVGTHKHSATLSKGTIGVLHGTRTILLQDNEGQSSETHSISAGLDYPGVGPEHAHLKTSGRAEYVSIDDAEAIKGFKELAEKEGILPALESSHAIRYAIDLAKTMKPDQNILVCLSGRGDKDMGTVAKVLGYSL